MHDGHNFLKKLETRLLFIRQRGDMTHLQRHIVNMYVKLFCCVQEHSMQKGEARPGSVRARAAPASGSEVVGIMY
jgi:hypothetical protein